MSDRFKLGDRVRFTGLPSLELPDRGATGEIISVLAPDIAYRYRVRWDVPVTDGVRQWNEIPMRGNELEAE